MTEEQSDADHIEAATPWGKIVAHGSTALIIGVVGYLIWIVQTENLERSHEHDQIHCLVSLDIYVHTFKAGETIDLRSMPRDVWGCIPAFLTESQKRREN